MRRRDFLKGIFGAAAIAAVPTIVLKQIDDLPPEPDEKVAETILADTNIPAGKKTPTKGILYVWDKDTNQLVAGCTDFSLNIHMNPIDVTQWGDMFPQFIAGPVSWDVQADNMQWLVDPMELFTRNDTHLQCLMAAEDKKFCGDVMLERLETTACSFPYFRQTYDATFQGRGALEWDA